MGIFPGGIVHERKRKNPRISKKQDIISTRRSSGFCLKNSAKKGIVKKAVKRRIKQNSSRPSRLLKNLSSPPTRRKK